GAPPPPPWGGAAKAAPAPAAPTSTSAGSSAGTAAKVDPTELALPTDPDSVVQYLSNSYRGVGRKTAETLVEAFGDKLFQVLQEQPERVNQVVPESRAEKVLEGWNADYARRAGTSDSPSSGGSENRPTAVEGGQDEKAPPRRTRGRTRRTRGGSGS
ncbi:MAG: hypothetical protein WEA09_12185, partial [Gemmatimonadota bacterium]